MGTENLSSKSDLIQFGFHQLIETIAEASSMSLDELENTLIEESIFRFFMWGSDNICINKNKKIWREKMR